jgi:4-carboxymuconolactone decarboxylase
MPSRQYDEGLAIRREVLGDEYVNNALQAVSDFSRPLQDWLNQHCWGEVWARPGIPRNVRSLVTIAMLCALRAPQEIRAHVRGAPAAVDAFRAAREVIDTWEA